MNWYGTHIAQFNIDGIKQKIVKPRINDSMATNWFNDCLYTIHPWKISKKKTIEIKAGIQNDLQRNACMSHSIPINLMLSWLEFNLQISIASSSTNNSSTSNINSSWWARGRISSLLLIPLVFAICYLFTVIWFAYQINFMKNNIKGKQCRKRGKVTHTKK